MKFKPSSLLCFPLLGTVALVLILGSLPGCKKQSTKKSDYRRMGPSPGAAPAQPTSPAARKVRRPSKVEVKSKRSRTEQDIGEQIRRQMMRMSRKKTGVDSFDPKAAILKYRESLEKVEKRLQRLSPSGTRIRQNDPKAKEVCALAQGICFISKNICKISRTKALSPNDCRETKAACRRAVTKCPANLRKSFEIDM